MFDFDQRTESAKKAYKFTDVIFKYVSWLLLTGAVRYFAVVINSTVLTVTSYLLTTMMYVPISQFILSPDTLRKTGWKAAPLLVLEFAISLSLGILTNFEIARLVGAIAARYK